MDNSSSEKIACTLAKIGLLTKFVYIPPVPEILPDNRLAKATAKKGTDTEITALYHDRQFILLA